MKISFQREKGLTEKIVELFLDKNMRNFGSCHLRPEGVVARLDENIIEVKKELQRMEGIGIMKQQEGYYEIDKTWKNYYRQAGYPREKSYLSRIMDVLGVEVWY